MDLAVDDGEIKLAIGRGRFDVSPLRGFEKPGQDCGEFFHGRELESRCGAVGYFRRKRPMRFDLAQRVHVTSLFQLKTAFLP
jgi:hypothetical protein